MFERILLPLDGSALSELLLPLAGQFAKSFDCSIDLLYVITMPDESIPDEITNQVLKEGREYLEKKAALLSADIKQTRIGCLVHIGHPASVIIEQSETQDNTLILMAPRAHSGLKRLMMGSVTDKVIQAATMPVLLIPPETRIPQGEELAYKRIVVPLDGSKLAESILPYVIDLCKALDMDLILVRSYHPNFPGSSVRMHDVSQIVHDSAEAYLEDKTEQLKREEGLKSVSYTVLRGLPAHQICNFAVETENSLTAMSTHGRQGVGRWMLGSVTNAVSQCSEEPVLIIRSADADQGDD